MSLPQPLRLAISSPHAPSPNPKFVIANQTSSSSDIKLYSYDRTAKQLGLVGLQTDLGQLRAVAWSGIPQYPHIVAAGLSTGRTLLLNLSPSTLTYPLGSNTSVSNLPSSTLAVLPVKQSRPVTALDFSTHDPNYLASGLERHRSDYSLLVWDISTAFTTLPPETNAPFSRQPERLGLGVQHPRTAPGEIKNIQHYCPAEHIHSVAFVPGSISHLLASANNRSIRLFDIRSPTPTNARDPSTPGQANWITRAVNCIKPHPVREERFASYEIGQHASVVRIWDTRKREEVLSFDVQGSIVGLNWTEKGELSVGSREGGVTLWDVVDGKRLGQDGMDEWVALGGCRQLVKPKQPLHAFSLAPPSSPSNGDVLFVVRDGTIGIGPITSSQALASSARGDMSISSPLRIYDASHDDIHLIETDDELPPEDGELEDSPRQNRFQLPPSRVASILHDARSSRSQSPSSFATALRGTSAVRDTGHVESRGRQTVNEDLMHEADGELALAGLGRTLGTDVGVVMRRRAEEGYGLSDMLLNAAVATRYPGRERVAGMWEFVQHLTTTLTAEVSQTRLYDFTYAGVLPLWFNDSSLHENPVMSSPPSSIRSHSTLTDATVRDPAKQISAAWTSLRHAQGSAAAPTKPTLASLRGTARAEADDSFSAAVDEVMARRGPDNVGRLPIGSKDGIRKAILAVCGGAPDLAEVNRLVQDEQRTKAAAMAYFAGDADRAVSVLQNSPNSKHHLISTTISAFLASPPSARSRQSTFNDNWRAMVSRIEDPYVRCMLSRIGGESWESVLGEEGVGLLDRIGMAVLNLSDAELSSFLSERQRHLSRSTDLANLPLTGFTPSLIPLLGRHLDRTGDIQTVALLSSLIPSTRLGKAQREIVARWREGYRDLLDAWGLWGQRVEFDVLRRQEGADAKETTEHVCPVCAAPLGKLEQDRVGRKVEIEHRAATMWPSERTKACSLCAQVLPRCCICLTHVSPPHLDDAHTSTRRGSWEARGGKNSDALDGAYVCCLTCRHGGHANHILSWFEGGLDGTEGHDTCPVAGCSCACANLYPA
ncbi:hypothetical protein BCR39DRAFT_517213 [Naematelia encephala]|uniref:Uncharacterized protein n=1 Tax=Naematelia encephala TaxID=71784 RepID=A0A1Y2BJE4_9TREE|nr:hypothetical protein BCR39DRAFT_517213 [Naematelia encephala]